MVKSKLLALVRMKKFQKFWAKLHHLSLIGMNYWGGASLHFSGEASVINFIASSRSNQDMVVFDVGANVGDYAALILRVLGHYTQVYCFEPSKSTFDLLAARFAASSTVQSFQVGMGERPEILNLYTSEKAGTLASVYLQENPLRPFDSALTEQIQLTSIDDFCQSHGIEKIDLLKLDIEGHEYKALLGARRLISENAVRFIQFEFGEASVDARVYLRDIISFLRPRYSIYRIVADGLVPVGQYSGEIEIFLTANYLAILNGERLPE